MPYILFTIGLALLITCYATQPADERIEPHRVMTGYLK